MADPISESSPKTEQARSGLRTEEIGARTIRRERLHAYIGPVDWTPAPVEEVDLSFPHLRVLELLGRGGMGAVYKARQLSLDRLVALKVLPPELAQEKGFSERFTREVRVMSQLNHPSVVAIYDQGSTAEGQAYFVMEYVAGRTLHDLLQTGTVTLPQKMAVFGDICAGLAYAHRQGVIHRDMKPNNVLIDEHGRAKIADFGMARLVDPETSGMTSGNLLGTPAYMAPEQIDGGAVDHRADIYALGVMLYELLCGEVPRGHVDPPSVRVGADVRFDELIARAMHNRAERRPNSVEELWASCREIFPDTPLRGPALFPPPKPEGSRRSLVALFASNGALLALSLLLGFSLWRVRHKKEGESAGHRTPATTPSAETRAKVRLESAAATGRETEEKVVWHDWIAEQKAKGSLPDGLEFVPDESEPCIIATRTHISVDLGPVARDQAVRVTYSLPERRVAAGMQLHVRVGVNSVATYFLQAHVGEWRMVRQLATGQKYTLNSLARPQEEMRPMVRHQVELRVRGSTLDFFHDGVLKDTRQDSYFTQGNSRFRFSPEARFHKIEWSDLGG